MRACQMRELLAPEHRVTLLVPAPAAGQPPPPPGAPVEIYQGAPAGARGGLRAAAGIVRAAARGLPLESGLFYSADLRRQLRRLLPRTDLAVLQLVRLAVHLPDCAPAPVLVDLIDDLALNLARRAAVDRWWLRPALRLESRLLARAQRRLAGETAGLLLVCERDRGHLARGLPPAQASRVRTAGLVVEAEGGSPARRPPAGAAMPVTAHQAAAEPGADEAPAGAPRLVFSGNLGYFVNADAISWWLREVWPALAARHPGVELVVAGDRPGTTVRRLVAAAAAAAGGRVSLVASPPDLRELLAGATIALAPLRCGSGVPVKVLEAWAQGVPVVASPWAAAGTTGVAGEDLLVAATPEQWVGAVCTLLQDEPARRRLAAAGRRRLAADYSRQGVKRQLLAAMTAAVAGEPGA